MSTPEFKPHVCIDRGTYGEKTISVYALDEDGVDLIDPRDFPYGVAGDKYETKNEAMYAAERYAKACARELGCDYGSNDYD